MYSVFSNATKKSYTHLTNLVTTCDLVTIFQMPFFKLLGTSDLVTLCNLVTIFAET